MDQSSHTNPQPPILMPAPKKRMKRKSRISGDFGPGFQFVVVIFTIIIAAISWYFGFTLLTLIAAATGLFLLLLRPVRNFATRTTEFELISQRDSWAAETDQDQISNLRVVFSILVLALVAIAILQNPLSNLITQYLPQLNISVGFISTLLIISLVLVLSFLFRSFYVRSDSIRLFVNSIQQGWLGVTLALILAVLFLLLYYTDSLSLLGIGKPQGSSEYLPNQWPLYWFIFSVLGFFGIMIFKDSRNWTRINRNEVTAAYILSAAVVIIVLQPSLGGIATLFAILFLLLALLILTETHLILELLDDSAFIVSDWLSETRRWIVLPAEFLAVFIVFISRVFRLIPDGMNRLADSLFSYRTNRERRPPPSTESSFLDRLRSILNQPPSPDTLRRRARRELYQYPIVSDDQRIIWSQVEDKINQETDLEALEQLFLRLAREEPLEQILSNQS